MNILVTGGSGFLGSHVADALSSHGHNVSIFDNKESIYLKSNQSMIIGDLLDPDDVSQALKEKDIVYHYGGISDIDECKTKPLETAQVNIMGTLNLLEASRMNQVKRFIFASSVYVFSNSGHFYGSSKQACESFIQDYADLYELKYTNLRYGSLYGPRSDNRNGIYRLIYQAVKDKKITFEGSGDELREFIHVKDAAKSSVKILDPDYENQNIIITGHEKLKFSDLLNMIKEIMNNQIEIEYLPKQESSHYNVTPYNFNPKVGLKLTNNPHYDMGQGLLQSISEVYSKMEKKE